MVELADRIAVMRDFTVQGEVENTHAYDEMSRAVINLIHLEPAGFSGGDGAAS
jgi:ribose transport system ATP-binding protein